MLNKNMNEQYLNKFFLFLNEENHQIDVSFLQYNVISNTIHKQESFDIYSLSGNE